MIQFQRVDEKGFADLREDWSRLLQLSGQRSIFLTWEWLFSWWQHFHHDKKLYLLCARENGEVVAICPFCLATEKTLLGAKNALLKFMGTEKVSSEYLDIICEPGRKAAVLERLMQYLLANKDEWDIFSFSNALSDCSSLRLLKQSAKQNGLLFTEQVQDICPYFTLPGAAAAFLQTLSKNMRYHVRRRARALEKTGVRYVSLADHEDIKDRLDVLYDLHRQRWQDKQQTGNFVDQRVLDFHRTFSGMASVKGWIRLTFLQLDGQYIASLYGFEYADLFWYYQAGMNPEYHALSPGVVLFWLNIRESIDKGFSEFDCLRGDEQYKWRWTPSFRKTQTLKIYNSGVRTFIIASLERNKSKVKEAIRS